MRTDAGVACRSRRADQDVSELVASRDLRALVETSGESLPIVMEDILVNFDEDRAARAARSIEALAATCPVIYFTCHPATPLQAALETTLCRLDLG